MLILRSQREIKWIYCSILCSVFFQGHCRCCGAASVLVEIGALKMKVVVKKVRHAAYDMSS